MLKSRPFAAPLSLGALCVGAFLAAAPAAGAAEGYPRATVSALAPGQPVTVEGRVVRVTDEDEFLLADPTGQVEVYVRRARLPLLAGEAVTVRGVVDDDRSLEIYAEEVIRADGSAIRAAPGYD